MEKRKSIPPTLVARQEHQRQETMNKVLRAIEDIKAEGRKVSISTLVEFTGLSRSAFAKPHIRSLLEGLGYAPRTDAAKTPRSSIKSNGQDTVEKDRMIAQLRARNKELERECELLRGRLYLAMQK